MESMLGRVVYIGVPADAPRRMDVEGMAATLDRIVVERVRQDLKWGTRRTHTDGTGGIGRQEVADRCRSLCDGAAAAGAMEWGFILSEEVAEAYAEAAPEKLEAELVQVAAVAVAWLEDLRRRRMGLSPRTQADAPQPKAPAPEACQRCGGRAFTGERMGPLGWRKCASCGIFTATTAAGVYLWPAPRLCTVCNGADPALLPTVCSRCKGTRLEPEAEKGPPCPACHGEGRLEGAACAHCQGRGEAP